MKLFNIIVAQNEAISNFHTFCIEIVRILQLGEHDEYIFDDNTCIIINYYCIFEMDNLILIYIVFGSLAVSSRLFAIFNNLNWYVGKPFLGDLHMIHICT